MAIPEIRDQRVFAYIITTVDSHYRLTGYVPIEQDGRVFFGPCKEENASRNSRGRLHLGHFGFIGSPAEKGHSLDEGGGAADEIR